MNTALLISAVLFGLLRPLPASLPQGVKTGHILLTDSCVVAAVIPENTGSYEGERKTLQEAADELSRSTGKPVVLTRDLITYMILLRMEKRGADPYERKNLATRLSRLNGAVFTSLPSKNAVS